MEKKKYLKDNIKYLRNKNKLSYDKFATYVKISRFAIVNIEKGLTEDPSIVTIIAIAKAFDITVGDLLYKDLKGGDEVGGYKKGDKII